MALDASVARYVLSLSGSRDATTGWYIPTWTEDTGYAYEGLHFDRGSTIQYAPPGTICTNDAVVLTPDPFEEGDIYYHTPSQRYFYVESMRQVWLLNSFGWRELQLKHLPMWQSGPSSATWKTSPDDPRSNIKDWIDLNARVAQITKDDGTTQAAWACMFANPPYYLQHEFRNPSGPVDGLYVLEQPVSTPTPNFDQTPYGYDEVVPIHICTIDSTGVSAEQLRWGMERELRYVAENFPTGSQLGFQSSPIRNESRALGSMWLLDIVYHLNYWRDKTT